MLSHIRSLSTRPARSWASASGCRCLSVSVPRNDEPVARAPRRSRSRSVRLTADNAEAQYDEFLNSEGRRFKSANKPNNWLGDTVVEFIPFFLANESAHWRDTQPFPLNPTFRPPPPISDQLRTTIYNAYMSDPAVYTVRKLSELYNISIRRVDAILRLKGLEAYWKKVRSNLHVTLQPTLVGPIWWYQID